MRRQAGVALLLVLWALALLGLVMGKVVATVRLEDRQTAQLWQETRGRLAAEAGLALAVEGLRAPQREQRWVADGREYRADFEGMVLSLRLSSERGKLDLNTASPVLFARLAGALGATEGQAAGVAAGLQARQRAGAVMPMRTPEELSQVPGMDYALYTRMEPYVTVWSGDAAPIAAFAAAPVGAMLGDALDGALGNAFGNPAAASPEGMDPGPVVSIFSEARSGNGFRSRLTVTVLLASAGAGSRPYRVLRWRE